MYTQKNLIHQNRRISRHTIVIVNFELRSLNQTVKQNHRTSEQIHKNINSIFQGLTKQARTETIFSVSQFLENH